MSKAFIKDIVGQTFGYLTVLKFVPQPDKKESYWFCVCECGNSVMVRKSNLISGSTISCGCYGRENLKKVRVKHGGSETRLYSIWEKMKERCYGKRSKNYYNYGGRGINVCEEWKNNFDEFRKWATINGYKDDLTLDRIDVNGNYEPSNCRWATIKEQNRNKRNSIMVEYKGEKVHLKEAAELTGISYSTLSGRYYKGERGERLFRNKKKNGGAAK